MNIRCPSCQKIFGANSQQELQINTAIKKNQQLLFVECPECYKDIPINPNNLLSTEPQRDEDKNNNSEIIQCPVCDEGIISSIDDGNEKFWGCGECGNVWFSIDTLNEEATNKI